MSDDEQAERRQWLTAAVGQTEAVITKEVLESGLSVRITTRDGVNMACTRDYNVNRVNLRVEQGVVTHATFG